jgi:2-polyprenyl-3-methyl-5-hydroxy-6-metoxy-1,4-benzoquinol methylase
MSIVLNTPYQLDTASGLWARPDYGGIPYTDGIEVENHLYELVQSVTDRSVLSSDMRALCTDWVTTYHFSGLRANLLRPFEAEFKGATTLEIGAGCGAITRYLAEAGAHVLALEGSPRRARIAQSRTEGLPNVTLLTENFDHFDTEQRFDVITLIGVLEYAGRFVQGANPTVAMLEKVRRLLKPNGRLIIAIENQYGLKYFAGALEDHVGQAMFGIEDRYQVKGVNTFGRAHLQRLLQQAGFAQNDFYAPFPDYKLPVSIVSQAGFDHPHFKGAEFASQSAQRDMQMPHVLAFAPDQVWPGLERNGLAMDLSNSFLLVAQPQAHAHDSSGQTLAWHFSAERLTPLCKLTTFEAVGNSVQVHSRRLSASAPAHVALDGLHNRLNVELAQPYIVGETMASRIGRTWLKGPWQLADLAQALQPYLAFLHERDGVPPSPAFNPQQELRGELLDALPQNAVVDEQGHVHLIDDEWVSESPITWGFLLFRAMQGFALSAQRVAPCTDHAVNTPAQLIQAAFAALGQPISEEALQSCLAQEAALQTQIGGQSPEAFAAERWDFLKHHHFSQQLLSEQAQRLEHQVAVQATELSIITGSRWWRLGASVRWTMRLWRRLKGQ